MIQLFAAFFAGLLFAVTVQGLFWSDDMLTFCAKLKQLGVDGATIRFALFEMSKEGSRRIRNKARRLSQRISGYRVPIGVSDARRDRHVA